MCVCVCVGAAAVATAITINTTLHTLKLADNEISDQVGQKKLKY
jgi:hypothetical protein